MSDETTKDPIELDFQFFLKKREELLREFLGRVIVIHRQEVAGDFDTALEAMKFGIARYGRGQFLIQECSDDKSTITRTFRSRFAPA